MPFVSPQCHRARRNNQFTTKGIEAKHWQTTQPIREVFKQAFAKANIPYAKPHTLRDTLTHYGMKICKTPEQFKAFSQNFGHENVLTTFKLWRN